MEFPSTCCVDVSFRASFPHQQDKGVQIIAIGIGRTVLQEDLEAIASPDNVIMVESFDELPKRLKDIEKEICGKHVILNTLSWFERPYLWVWSLIWGVSLTLISAYIMQIL